MSFLHLLLWVIFALLDVDPDRDSTDQNECGSVWIRINNTAFFITRSRAQWKFTGQYKGLYLRRRQAGCPCGGRVRKCHGPSWRPGEARWSFDHSEERLLSPCKEISHCKILLEIKLVPYFLSLKGFQNFWLPFCQENPNTVSACFYKITYYL